MRMDRVRYLALEGGGTKGISEVPALIALHRVVPLADLEAVAGTSAGAILAMLIVMGAEPREILSILSDTEWGKFAPGRWRAISRLVRFAFTWGLFPNKYPRQWLERQSEALGFSKDVTFRELYEATGTRLMVTAVNMDLERPEVFSEASTPDVPVVQAVLASMSIQVFYPPVVINGHHYNDGGLVWNLPLDLFRGEDPETVLAVRVGSPGDLTTEAMDSPLDVIMRSIGIARQEANDLHIPPELEPRIITVITDHSAVDFNLSDRDITDLLVAGVRATGQWLAQ